MDLKTRIKIALGLDDEAIETKEVKLMYEGKLEDGTIIVSEADELAAGVVVNILSEDGVQTPMPEGTYTTEDGTIFSVDAEGVVLEVAEAEAEEVEEEEGDLRKEDEEYMNSQAELFAEVGSVVKELLEEVRKDITRISSELEEIRNENFAKDENIAELQKENTNLEAQVKELGSEPAEEPVKVSKFAKAMNTNEKPYEQMTRQEKYYFNLNNK
tara:strand:+ start:10740 stop:11381 length:642 start_codon:yes stop_codon:yes gene_type:complete